MSSFGSRNQFGFCGFAAVCAFVAAGCVPRSFNETASIVALNDQYLFTAMSRTAWEGNATVTSGVATQEMGLRRFAYRGAGLFSPTEVSSDGYQNFSADLSKQYLMQRKCDANLMCEFGVGIQQEGDSIICAGKGEKESANIFLDCYSEQKKTPSASGIVLSFRKAVVDGLAINRVKPNTQFETFRTGPLFTGDDQSLLQVPAGRAIQFEVDERLASNPAFVKAYRQAIGYWNAAAGRVVISDQFATTNNFVHGPKRSLIKFNEAPSGGTLARANSFADPVTGGILSMRVDVFVVPTDDPAPTDSASFQWVLTHELGHALGMAHNFAGSFDPSVSKEMPSTSVMDYLLEFGSDSRPLPYDAEYMHYVYQGTIPAARYLHCNDVETSFVLGCARYDVPRQDVSKLILRVRDYSQLTPQKLSTVGKDYQSLLPLKAIPVLLEMAESGSPTAVARLLLAAPSLTSAAIKHLSFDDAVTAAQRADLISALRARLEFLLAKGVGIAPDQARWLNWYLKYAENPMFSSKNKMEFMKALHDLSASGFEAPHHADCG